MSMFCIIRIFCGLLGLNCSAASGVVVYLEQTAMVCNHLTLADKKTFMWSNCAQPAAVRSHAAFDNEICGRPHVI